jgi:hypothetical protein
LEAACGGGRCSWCWLAWQWWSRPAWWRGVLDPRVSDFQGWGLARITAGFSNSEDRYTNAMQRIWWVDQYLLEVVIDDKEGVVGCHVGRVCYPGDLDPPRE